MADPLTQTVRITPRAATGSGRRRGWIKRVTSIDPRGRDGYAVHGEFLADGREVDVPVGSILLSVEPAGSVKHASQVARILRVDADGALNEVLDEHDWRRQFLTVRDRLAALMAPAADAYRPVDADPLAVPALLRGLLDDAATQIVEMPPLRFLELTQGAALDCDPWDPSPERLLSWPEWPWLEVDPETGQVHAHEGTHRITAARAACRRAGASRPRSGPRARLRLDGPGRSPAAAGRLDLGSRSAHRHCRRRIAARSRAAP
jgi:hypothetical protein